MSKIISYILFKGAQDFTELFYVRGFYFNVLMNSLVYPDWKTVVFVDEYMWNKYRFLFERLKHKVGVDVQIFAFRDEDPLCKKMLWRMMPVFYSDVTHVICRDADALTSLREANAVKDWVESGITLHGINDNPAHSIPLLGGLCGFKAYDIRKLFGTWENMIAQAKKPIDKHGSDQDFLNGVVLHKVHGSIFVSGQQLLFHDRNNPLWTSDLCTAFIGSAGCNEMETLRFFRDNLPDWGIDKELWKQYPKLFYWE